MWGESVSIPDLKPLALLQAMCWESSGKLRKQKKTKTQKQTNKPLNSIARSLKENEVGQVQGRIPASMGKKQTTQNLKTGREQSPHSAP